MTTVNYLRAGVIKSGRVRSARAAFIHLSGKILDFGDYSMTIITCSVSTLSLALTLISFTVPRQARK